MPVPPPALTTPHAGYHWPGGLLLSRARPFFEGWYYRVSLPEVGESFAFMYAIAEPADGGATSGGFAQILAPGDERLYHLFDEVRGFWAEPDRLALGHSEPALPQPGLIDPARFASEVQLGYQATATLNQGVLKDAAWCYRIEPVAGWGRPGRPEATMGWLSYLPVFEPGWQILMAHGRATGWIEWRGARYSFEDAPAYGEKNWGGAFPKKWFWVQANAFEADPEAALIAGGGRRGFLWREESVAMVGLYHGGRFYRFLPEDGHLRCAVTPWGRWQIEAVSERYRIEVSGTAARDDGIELLAPTATGAHFVCRDTLKGSVQVRLSRRWGTRAVLFEGSTRLGGLETGGGPWEGEWQFRC